MANPMPSFPPSSREFAAALQTLAIFPLPQTVLFPGALLPLHVFEPRYRAMVKDCVGTQKVIAIALIRENERRDAHGHPAIEQVAGLGVIIDHTELPDGRWNILVQGRSRVALEELPFVPPYRRAHARILSSEASTVAPPDLAALLASAAAFAGDIRARDPGFDFSIPPHTAAGAAADLAAHHLVLDARERQRILETLDVAQRVRMATEALALQHTMLHTSTGRPSN